MRSRAHRVNNLTTVCVLITALLVLSTGIVGGVYLYRQFIHYRVSDFQLIQLIIKLIDWPA